MAKELIVFIDMEIPEMLTRVEALKLEGYRLMQIHCTRVESGYEINYTFALDLPSQNLRIHIDREQEIPSISGIFPAAFLYENEIHDLFGLNITDMLIDYHGRFYRTSVPAPFGQAKKDTGGGE